MLVAVYCYFIISRVRLLDYFRQFWCVLAFKLSGSKTYISFARAFSLSMSQLNSTFNSLSAGLFSTMSSLAPSSSAAHVVVTVASSVSSRSFSSEIAVAVAHALEDSLPAIISTVRENAFLMSNAPPSVVTRLSFSWLLQVC